MPATDKAALMAVTGKEFDKLTGILREIPQATGLKKDGDDTSIKDIVAHRAHWIDLFLGWYADGQSGKEVHFPAPGYKWNDLPRYNAMLRQSQADMGWQAANQSLQDAHARLIAFLSGRDDAALYGGPMKGTRNAWTPGRWAEAAGPSHYRSAAKYIKKRLREG